VKQFILLFLLAVLIGYGSEARVCDYAWVLGIREQCIVANVPFHFKQTGAHFRKDGRLYNIPRNQQMKQAHRAAIDLL
jgi:protein gp37